MSALRIDNTSPLWTYSSPCNVSGPSWNSAEGLPGYFNNTESTTNVVGARATFVFQGTAVAYFGTMWAQGANATVYLDDLSENISTTLTNGSTLQSIAIWSRSNLDPDTLHSLTVEMTGGGTLDIDYVEILTPPPAVTPPAMPTPIPAAFPGSSKWVCNSTAPSPPISSDTSKPSHASSSVPVMVGSIIGSIAITAILSILCIRYRRRRRSHSLVHDPPESTLKFVPKDGDKSDKDEFFMTAPRIPGLKIDPWDPPPVFMSPEQRAAKRLELNSKLVLDISAAVNRKNSNVSTSTVPPEKQKEDSLPPYRTSTGIFDLNNIRPLPPVTSSLIVHVGASDHQYTAVPNTSESKDWDDAGVDEKDHFNDAADADDMYAAHSWENEDEDAETPLIGSTPASPVPSSRLSSSHNGGAVSSLSSSGQRAHSRAHRILRSVRSRKSSLSGNMGIGKRSTNSSTGAHRGGDHRSTGQTASTNFSIVATASSTPRTPSSSQSMAYGGKMLTLTGPGSGSVVPSSASSNGIRPLPTLGNPSHYLPSPMSTSPAALSTESQEQESPSKSNAKPGPTPSSPSWLSSSQRKRANARRPPMGPRTQTSGSDMSVETEASLGTK